jgi:mRNA-degrading endonuclease toxin of MazEF toxin-antitoxin module
MKYLLIMALVVACTTKEKKAPAEAPVESTESDAKPVSPYTVQPCYCMKIEAECQGHKTWTEGSCK